jgi:hypothetical protein
VTKGNKKSTKELSKTLREIVKASVQPKPQAVTPPKKKKDKKK